MGPLNYLFMHTAEAGAYCLGVFDNGQSGTLLGGITFRNILVEVSWAFAGVCLSNKKCCLILLSACCKHCLAESVHIRLKLCYTC